MQQIGHDSVANAHECSFLARIGLWMIRVYQRVLSPYLGSCCRFRPSCSHYTYEAIQKYGLLKGCLLGGWRICRCNPLSRGGDDPVN
ncbi:MAG: membrane protein insertion efficiency factor YidD [Candidatus Riflebacteria bacterium HGW-Riflebacteria-1]|nr:MAG: membrane protein insertion efficiency factor YidD [Candidatus Riflebacteria bacterium HGW-Riflebacteria-1]